MLRLQFISDGDHESDSDYVPSTEAESTSEETELEQEEDYLIGDNEKEAKTETEDGEDNTYLGELIELEKIDPLLYEKFQQVRKYLQDKLPSVDKIIRADIDISSKADLVELYEILMTTEPTTIEWICLRDEINEQFDIAIVKYRDYLTLTDEQKQAIEYTKNVIHRDASWVMEQQIACLPLKKEHKDLVWEKYLRMAKMDSSGEEWGKINEWISVVLKIPWCESSGGGEDFIERPQHTYLSNPVEIQLKNIYNQLNSEFYGLEKVKDSILMYVNNRLRGGGENIKGSGGCLALLGASGTGKTSIARSISKILNLPFSQISCDALSKNSLVGHSYTYIGSQCGFIVKSLIDMKTSNGVIFLDEIDKISDEKNLGGLLNIIDPSQNSTFKDAYIGTIPIDLSQVWFICSMNKLPENKALLDRLHVINISGYTRQNKLDILKNHTFRKLEKTSALNFNVSDAIFNLIIDKSKEESGVRMCEFMLKHLMTTLEFMWQNPDVLLSVNKNNDRKIVVKSNPCVIEEWMVHRILTEDGCDLSWKNMYI